VVRPDEQGIRAAVPELTGTIRLQGLEGPVEIVRDELGIPHVRAGSTHDAFFAQGFYHAQDRLWQMEYDRRRAYGRWAELAGSSGLDQDILMRRLGLGRSAEADYAAFDAETRAMFDAYAAGVNAFITTTPALPVEFSIVGTQPAPWQPWDGCAIYKVRHVLMSTWANKLWRARQLRLIGPDLLLKLRAGAHIPAPIVIPPGSEGIVPLDEPDTLAGAEAIAGLWEWAAGSNNWVLHGSRTASGLPLMAGDPHRALDVPNVYYQNHLACPEFDTIGYSFAGVPGFPHFGHNAEVAWCITNGGADYQDLYVEKFAPGDPTRYEYQGAWLPAERRRETIVVHGADPVEIDVTVTRHGPIVQGDPAGGYALALRYTATTRPNAGFTAFPRMLRARKVAELDEAMRPWVDPSNNFLMADRQGTIGYLLRGQIPLRDRANAWLPVPGWTGAHEWTGEIPFETLPRSRNPETGYIATANNRIVGDDYPYFVALDWTPPYRAQRLAARLHDLTGATVADMAAVHRDILSLPSRVFVAALARVEPTDERTAEAKRVLLAWDGQMTRDAVAPALYAVWREQVTALVLAGPALAALGQLTVAREPVPLRAITIAGRLRAPLVALLQSDDPAVLPPGETWPTLLARALRQAVAWLAEHLGPELANWTWDRLHHTAPTHPLAAAYPELAESLNPPAVSVPGDGDTPRAAAFAGVGFTLTNTSVARYCFDLADWDNSGWVVPLGASGHPGSAHFADQVAAWSEGRLLPMRYTWDRVNQGAATRQRLEPAS
jgi:penicillin G amidase